ncbi:hypothetical protein [Treponema primitia]|uniref:hypothetical protein n=1 Tax=Treponema primitia TaxID=88058 RepID=UPI000255569E|nr:hypothetical protein [Treponema primitia]
MIYYRKKNGVKIAEIWYNLSELPDKKTDVFIYKFTREKHLKAVSIEERFTIVSDLTKTEAELLSLIHKNARYKINRANERDDIQCVTHLEKNEKNKEKLFQYMDFFNTFAGSKNRSKIHFSDLKQFYENGTLCIRSAIKDDTLLAMHAYIISDNTVRLHQSASHFRASEDSEYRNLIGRANRFLHWDDILHFKNDGLSCYDFGGWYGGKILTERLLINHFKEEFGGDICREYSFIVPISLLGKMSIYFHAVFKVMEKIWWRRKDIVKKIKRKNNNKDTDA